MNRIFRLIFLTGVLSIFNFQFSISHAQKVTLSLPWLPQAQFAGVYVAQEKGFFQEAGLDVRIVHPTGPTSTLARQRVAQSDFLVEHLSTMLIYNDTTTRDTLVQLLQLSQHATTVIVSRRPLASAADLKGMRIACWVRGRNETPVAYLKSLGVEVEWVPTESSNNAPFVAGAVDATLAMEYNELFQFRLNGINLKNNQILRLSETPFDIPADGLYVKASYLRAHPREVQALAQAVRRGWEWLAQEENRAEGLRISLECAARGGNRTNPMLQRHMLASILQHQTLDGRRPYTLDRQRLERAATQLRSAGMIKHPVDYATFIHRIN